VTLRIRVSVDLDAPPGHVWSVIEPIERHVDWMGDAERITFRTERRRGVGTEFDCVTRIGPFRTTDRMTVVEWEPGSALGIEHRGVVTGRGRFTLAPLGAASDGPRTRVTWEEELRLPAMLGGRVGERVAGPLLRRVWRANLARLREIVSVSDR
jgi:hypothetical protein